MLKYPAEILLAFGEAIDGQKTFLDWLMKNGYPELGALATAVRGSEEAFLWLMKNGYPDLAALDSAIDGREKAYHWLKATWLFLLHRVCRCLPG
jgi:hypothetical protein